MSITIAAATQPADAGAGSAWVILIPWLALALAVMARAGVFRASAVVGPARVTPPERSVFFVILFLVALGVGMMAGAALSRLPVAEEWRLIVASAGIYAAGTVVMVLGNALLRERGLERFGLTGRLAPPGLWQGIVGLFALLPVVFLVATVLEMLTRAWEIPIPEHELLSRLKVGSWSAGTIFLIAVPVVLAPLFEEMLFRGVMQTFLVRVLAGRELSAAPGFPVTAEAPTTAPVDDSPMARIEMTEGVTPPMSRRVVARWMAIGITSLIFAAIHGQAVWIPPLFVLSVGLGYAYEKTGNLWVPIVMHALFNGLQITLFLTLQKGGG